MARIRRKSDPIPEGNSQREQIVPNEMQEEYTGPGTTAEWWGFGRKKKQRELPPGSYPRNPDPNNVSQAVWEAACRNAWNRAGFRDPEVEVTEEDLERGYSEVSRTIQKWGLKNITAENRDPNAGSQAPPAAQDSTSSSTVTVPGSSSVTVPMDTGGSGKRDPVQTKSSTGEQISGNSESTEPGAAPLVGTVNDDDIPAPQETKYDVDTTVGPPEQTAADRLREQQEKDELERRKWEKYQSIADMLTALGVVASAANNRQGAGRFDIVSAQMFQGPGRMNLVQAGQGFRLGPYIRRG